MHRVPEETLFLSLQLRVELEAKPGDTWLVTGTICLSYTVTRHRQVLQPPLRSWDVSPLTVLS